MDWTQAEAADALGMTPAAYRALERGQSYVTGKPNAINKRTTLACAAIEMGVRI